MFGLLVSHDSGRTYRQEREAHTLDESGLRQYLTRGGVEHPEDLCAVHKSIAQALADFPEELAETIVAR